jgi:hypothetical protein
VQSTAFTAPGLWNSLSLNKLSWTNPVPHFIQFVRNTLETANFHSHPLTKHGFHSIFQGTQISSSALHRELVHQTSPESAEKYRSREKSITLTEVCTSLDRFSWNSLLLHFLQMCCSTKFHYNQLNCLVVGTMWQTDTNRQADRQTRFPRKKFFFFYFVKNA